MTVWPVLDEVPADEVSAILTAGRRRRYARGETLFHDGDPADSLHLLDIGHVAVRALTPGGEQAILSVLGPGAAFGELALLGNDHVRSATITAIDPVESIVVHRRQWDALRRRHPSIDQFLLGSLSAQVARLSAQLLEVLYTPTPLRITRQLLTLGEDFGGVIPMTQEDIAMMCGTTRPTVNETLYERAGAVRIERRRITIVAPEVLAGRLARIGGGAR
jgi:CRP/FNR family transcriptional regulator, cyclic AMP receptor protein